MKCILVTVISFILIDISTTNIICNQPIKFEQNDDILRSNNDTLVFAHVVSVFIFILLKFRLKYISLPNSYYIEQSEKMLQLVA